MITTLFWKEIVKNIKKVKNMKLQYYKLKEEKITATFMFVIMIIVTPLFLSIDIFMSPFELLYLIVYKLLWRR